MPTLNSEGLIVLNKQVDLLPYKPRPFVERETMTDADIMENAGKTLFLNVESYPNYFVITFKLHKANKFFTVECGEGRSFNPHFLSWVMHNYKTVGFNSINYDLLLVWLAYHDQDYLILKECTNDLIVSGMRDKEVKERYSFKTFKTPHIDLIEVAPLTGSLKLYGARLHTKSIQEQPFDVNADLSEFEIEELKKFNCTQLCITEELFDFMKERLELREAMSAEYREDLMSKSDAQMAEIVLSKEVGKLNGKRIERPDIPAGSSYYYQAPAFLNFVTPEMQRFFEVCKRAKFVINSSGYLDAPEAIATHVKIGDASYSFGIGGLHSMEKNVKYVADEENKLTDRDVTSYYPNAILNLGLYPIAAGPNFLKVFRGFKDSRVEAKRMKNFSKDKGLKIFLNGTSGKFSDLWSKMRSPHLTMQMNLTCQLSILMLIEILHCNGLRVVSANTDGIVIYHKRSDQEKLDYWVKFWEKLTGFDTEETEYKGYYARDVNAYFAVKLDGKVKKKGPWAEVGSQSGTQLDMNPQTLICADAVEALLSKGIPIEETILDSKDFTRFVTVRNAKAPGAHKNREFLGKVLRWYYARGELGAIHYVATNNKVADTDGAKPCLEMPDSFPDDIDYSWYVKRAKEMLEDIGYLAKMKQIEFF
jgi:hypothetical protein